jgi:hypothetical protein
MQRGKMWGVAVLRSRGSKVARVTKLPHSDSRMGVRMSVRLPEWVRV